MYLCGVFGVQTQVSRASLINIVRTFGFRYDDLVCKRCKFDAIKMFVQLITVSIWKRTILIINSNAESLHYMSQGADEITLDVNRIEKLFH